MGLYSSVQRLELYASLYSLHDLSKVQAIAKFAWPVFFGRMDVIEQIPIVYRAILDFNLQRVIALSIACSFGSIKLPYVIRDLVLGRVCIFV